jgi:putative phosphoesterase
VRVGLVSDIHCNLAGLEGALDQMGAIDELFCAGDSVFQFRWSNEVIGRLRELGARVVLGNHEEILLGPDGVRALSNPKVDQDLVRWLREQPYSLNVPVDGRQVMMTHSSPWQPWRDYHYPHESIWARASELPCDALFVGHTHFQMAQRHGSTLVVNPGSAGDPRDHRNEFKLSCAVWDTVSDEVAFFDYDDPTRRFLGHSGQLSR